MQGYESFKQKVLNKTGIDLSLYKEKQMKRRLSSLAKRNGFDDFESYYKGISANKELFEEFVNYMTINVSEFYRNPEQWKVLEEDVIPKLLSKKKQLRVWSAACSTGEEPYSMVMLLSNFMPLDQIKIYATDLDEQAIEKAKRGQYTEKSLKNLPNNFIRDYFDKKGGIYEIKETIKKRVEFKKHNLLSDRYMDRCDLIVCRNVLIYFTEEAKSEIYTKFSRSLEKEGYLFVGSTEQIIMPSKYNLKALKTFFYGRIE